MCLALYGTAEGGGNVWCGGEVKHQGQRAYVNVKGQVDPLADSS